jgi:hypothetical protein
MVIRLRGPVCAMEAALHSPLWGAVNGTLPSHRGAKYCEETLHEGQEKSNSLAKKSKVVAD